jgi:hypothetical protein
MTSTLDGMGGQRHAPAAFIPGEDPVPIVQEAGWARGTEGTVTFSMYSLQHDA